MPPIMLIDGNNLGHVLGYIDKTADRYDSASLLACLDGVNGHLAHQRYEVEIVLFLDDASAAERLGGWSVHVAPVLHGNADAAIRAYAQAHTDHPQILVSADQALCDDVTVWGVTCLPPRAFISHYLVPARQAGFIGNTARRALEREWLVPDEAPEEEKETPPEGKRLRGSSQNDRGLSDRLLLAEALGRAQAILRGEPLATPEVYRLDLKRWSDAAELALYLAEHHLCPGHPDLTDPDEMTAAIREHCCHQARYFTSGRVINRIFRLFLCRPEHSLTLDALTQLASTRRRKIRAAITKYGEQLGIVVVW
jgi:hypothetical protein